jgi:hypothetical protein
MNELHPTPQTPCHDAPFSLYPLSRFIVRA